VKNISNHKVIRKQPIFEMHSIFNMSVPTKNIGSNVGWQFCLALSQFHKDQAETI